MALYPRGAYARNQQANLKSDFGVRRLDSRRATTMATVIKFKLLVNRKAIAALTANGGTLDRCSTRSTSSPRQKVTFIHVRKDGGARSSW